jgi:16S rRNA (guanine966-N2)-methyltransferase
LRIISGKYKGRQLSPHKLFNARPTTDFAKESLFNILNNYFYFEQIRVLDLFSGTGGIGLEFVSRGCTQIEMVESDQRNVKFIAETIKELNLHEIRLLKADVFKYIQTCKPGYHVIFADPPFDMEGLDTLPGEVFKRDLLTDDGWFILEHSHKYNFKNEPFFKEERHYGAVHFSIFRK